jgi:hypothetical protein
MLMINWVTTGVQCLFVWRESDVIRPLAKGTIGAIALFVPASAEHCPLEQWHPRRSDILQAHTFFSFRCACYLACEFVFHGNFFYMLETCDQASGCASLTCPQRAHCSAWLGGARLHHILRAHLKHGGSDVLDGREKWRKHLFSERAVSQVHVGLLLEGGALAAHHKLAQMNLEAIARLERVRQVVNPLHSAPAVKSTCGR